MPRLLEGARDVDLERAEPAAERLLRRRAEPFSAAEREGDPLGQLVALRGEQQTLRRGVDPDQLRRVRDRDPAAHWPALIDIGTSGVTGNDLVTIALGSKVTLNDHMEFGAAWETPISNRKDLIDHRVTVELILRY